MLVGTTTDRTGDRALLTVLVVGTDDWAIDQASSVLEAAGHRSARCHESGEPTFPCNAFLPGRTCPLRLRLDAVLSVRSRPVPSPAPGEMGVVCALRDGEPLVVAGMSDHNPFATCTTTAVDRHGDIPSACERAVSAARSACAPQTEGANVARRAL